MIALVSIATSASYTNQLAKGTATLGGFVVDAPQCVPKAMTSKESTVASLPEIPKQNPSLVEASGKRTTRSTPQCFEDSGLDLKESLASAYSTRVDLNSNNRSLISNGGAGRSPPRGAFTPSPPPGGPILRNGGISPSPRGQPQLRRSLEYVRLSRGELDRREQAISTLRAENLKLQAKIRELEQGAENYTLLHSACSKLAQRLGCSIDGVAADSVRDILTGKINQLTQDSHTANQQLSGYKSELERCKGELAAANVKSSHLETQIGQLRSSLASKEAEAKQTKSELESLQQSSARTGAMMQSLRQQLAEAEQRQASSSTKSDDLTQLQAEVGRMKTELKNREDSICELEMRLSAKQAEHDSVRERLTNSDMMYADLCSQLAAALQYEDNDSTDIDFLVSQVQSMAQETSELKLRIETMTKTINTAELDSKASRETILRLVSEAKKHEKSAGELLELRQAQDHLQSSMKSFEKERGDLYQRLAASQETLTAQEKELKAKERRISELNQTVQSLRLVSNDEKSLADSIQLKYEELCESLALMLESQTKDSVALLQQVQQLKATVSNQANQLTKMSSQISDLESTSDRRQGKLAQVEETLVQERSKVQQLEAELATLDIVKEGLGNELDKHKVFCKRLSKAVHLDNGVAEMLSGDFAHDAVLLKIEQLMKQETQALAEKQTALYTLQRKLKSSRQALESKELHLGLVQKKVLALEDRLQTYSHREADWENTTNKARKIERQLERLQDRASQQRETITKLKAESSEADILRRQCSEMEERLARQTVQIEELSQSRVHQAKQLAEARQKVQTSRMKERDEMEKLEDELRAARKELEKAKEKGKELGTFRTAVHKLLVDGRGKDAANLSDFDLVAKLEGVVAAQQKHKDERKCLEASLKQLELGFKASYEDALTLVVSTDT